MKHLHPYKTLHFVCDMFTLTDVIEKLSKATPEQLQRLEHAVAAVREANGMAAASKLITEETEKLIKPCTSCKCSDMEMSDNPDYAGLCVACECQKHFEDWDEAVETECETYNATHGTDYDFNTFYDACAAGEIALDALTELEELKQCYHMAQEDKAQAEFEATLPPFDPNNTELPF